ncbi:MULTISPECIES: regulatory protein RecX [unclassified Sedimentibacter]|uniref:regulatory protein RecX n=1 Tax=unclassified Sedimentibacter TaxID=2649220 RepID=UPI0027E151F1|nr:RecX family transcriptional regulator [Sedimentibacter sp. MB35-C1]WMJ77748.1 RecX family transcriptional regulator [Sedimentibacter sp. MB35-C1]
MKKITKIEIQKNNRDRVNIYLDDAFAFGIDLNIMMKYSLAKNMEIEQLFIDEILKAEEEIHVYNYALTLLSRRAMSEKQIRTKMKTKGYDEDFIDSAILKLKNQKYLDDERYSEMLINDKVNISKYGKRKIKQLLYEKGIERETIEEKIKCLSEEDELKRAYSVGLKKISSLKEEDDRKKYVKLSRFLINKGFELSTVRKAASYLLKAGIDDFGDFEDI